MGQVGAALVELAADQEFFAHRAQVHRKTTGREPPTSVAELLAQLAERAAMQEGM